MNHLAHRNDPETSFIAARNVDLGAQQKLVLGYVQRFPGLTSAELAAEHASIIGGVWQQYRPMFGRRLKELPGVEQGDKRVCGVCGSLCVTWRTVEPQQSLFG